MEADRPRAEGDAEVAGRPLVVRVEHLATAADVGQLPAPTGDREVALAGRSNVGKSSLLNALARGHRLAKVSKTPGKTRLLHLYRFHLDTGGEEQAQPRALAICDLPGYGWARASKQERERWRPMAEGYLTRRQSLAAVVVILDIRRGLMPPDELLFEMLEGLPVRTVVAATKLDKLSLAAREPAVEKLRSALPPWARRVVGCSAARSLGLQELWRAMLGALAGAAALLLCALTFASPAVAVAAEKPTIERERVVDRVLRTVGDEIITYSELQLEARLIILKDFEDRAEDVKPLTAHLLRDELQYFLERVTERRLVYVDARRHKRHLVPAEEVDKELLALLKLEKEESEWAALEKRWGATLDVLRRAAERRVVVARYVTERIDSKVKVSAEAVRTRYEENRHLYRGTFEEHREAIEAELLMAKIQRRRKEWTLELRKKYGVRTVSEP